MTFDDWLHDVIPASPPPEVLAAVDAAWERAGQLIAAGRGLHCTHDAASGRLVIEVRGPDGTPAERIAPSRVLDLMTG